MRNHIKTNNVLKFHFQLKEKLIKNMLYPNFIEELLKRETFN